MRADDYISIREALLEKAITFDELSDMYNNLKGMKLKVGSLPEDKRVMDGIHIIRTCTVEGVFPNYILVRVLLPLGRSYLRTVDKIDLYTNNVRFKILED